MTQYCDFHLKTDILFALSDFTQIPLTVTNLFTITGFHLGGGGGGGHSPPLGMRLPPLEIMWSYISDNDAPPQHPEFYICPPFGNFLNETLIRQVYYKCILMRNSWGNGF